MRFVDSGHNQEYEAILDLTRRLWNLWYNIESQWFAMASLDHVTYGYVTHTPRGIADQYCAGAITICNDILSRAGTITGETVTPFSWTSSKNSLYGVPVIVRGIEAQVYAMRTLFMTAHSNDAWDAYAVALPGFYSWINDQLSTLGPNFPTPITAFNTKAIPAAYDRPRIGAQFTDENELSLICADNYASGNMTCPQGDSSGYHNLTAGDTVAIVKLDIPGYTKFTGSLYNVNAVGAGGIVLDVMHDEQLPLVISDIAKRPGDVFMIRKVKDA